MIDPIERWRRHHGFDYKAVWAGLLTFADLPYTEDPAELAGFDVAIVGAPFDELVSDLPGTRLGPRAVRAATPTSSYHLEARVDWMNHLRVVDYGDAPIVPTDAVRSHKAIEDTVLEVLRAGTMPIVLGGDHSIAEPDVRACARHLGGPVGLVHFDTHTDTAAEIFGRELSHGTPMYNLVEQGHVDPRRYVQIGLRGWWPHEAELAWQAERGITSLFMHDVRRLGIEEVVRRDDRARRRRPGLPHGGRGRARPRLRAGHGNARAGRHDADRPELGLPDDRRRARARRSRRRRGDPGSARLGGPRRARRQPGRARDPHRARAAPLASTVVDNSPSSTYIDGMSDASKLADETASKDPAVGLAAVAALRALLESLEELQVENARAQGWSWRQIADALGVSKQAVHKKHGAARLLRGRRR